jgi:hypothetical protein
MFEKLHRWGIDAVCSARQIRTFLAFFCLSQNGILYTAAASVASLLGVHLAPDSLLAASNPVGTLAFKTVHADSCATPACFPMEDLLPLPLGDQDRSLILHGSFQKWVAHLPRACWWEYVSPPVQSAGSKAVDCAVAILAHPGTDCPLTDRRTLTSATKALAWRAPVLWRAMPPTLPLLPPASLPCEERSWPSVPFMDPAVSCGGRYGPLHPRQQPNHRTPFHHPLSQPCCMVPLPAAQKTEHQRPHVLSFHWSPTSPKLCDSVPESSGRKPGSGRSMASLQPAP